MTSRQLFFSFLNQTFHHIYVITLQRAAERHLHLQTELDGLDYQLFFGKDKRQFSVDDLQRQGIYNEHLAKLNHRYNKPMWDGQIGCAWSHREVCQDIVEKGYQTALILEDDVVINEAAIENFEAIYNQVPTDWELLYLGYAERESPTLFTPVKKGVYHLQHRFGGLKLSHETINHLYPKKITESVWEAGYHDCTHAYAVTAAAAKNLLALQSPISFVADNLLAYAVTNKIVNGYLVKPKIINQQCQVGQESVSYLNQ